MTANQPLALTMGDPAGIGGEIALKAWLTLRSSGPAFFALDDPDRLAGLARTLGLSVAFHEIQRPADATASFPTAFPVLPVRVAKEPRPGFSDPANTGAILASIRRAVALTQAGEAAALVTNPIHKASLYSAGFPFKGHTDFLGHLAGPGSTPVMMLAAPALRVVPVTVHVALQDAIRSLTTAAIVAHGELVARELRVSFGLDKPRLAVAGLNPHAGEDGTMGTEDRDIVTPAVAQLIAKGIAASGPLAADSMFAPRARARFDAAICMYHDQALIP
ncbi:MAG: 4-hydroxythreonine-4-phosphate dehydrogenase PdxA, partial [Proteobacteria bacterium]|nr:4-hydroxythreonine-4-phosphate dehydrogenase PdxA [Pseudomonadota bacterium]